MQDKYDPDFLDDEERELIRGLDKLDTDSIEAPSEKRQRELRRAARNYMEKRATKMNIRIDPGELDLIKRRAAREGLPYQTLVKSVLHKYVTGQLVEGDQEAG